MPLQASLSVKRPTKASAVAIHESRAAVAARNARARPDPQSTTLAALASSNAVNTFGGDATSSNYPTGLDQQFYGAQSSSGPHVDLGQQSLLSRNHQQNGGPPPADAVPMAALLKDMCMSAIADEELHSAATSRPLLLQAIAAQTLFVCQCTVGVKEARIDAARRAGAAGPGAAVARPNPHAGVTTTGPGEFRNIPRTAAAPSAPATALQRVGLCGAIGPHPLQLRVTVVGLGGVGKHVVDALIRSGVTHPTAISVVTRTPRCPERFTVAGVQSFTDMADAAGSADVFVLAVREAHVPAVAQSLHAAGGLRPTCIVVTVVAGMTADKIATTLKHHLVVSTSVDVDALQRVGVRDAALATAASMGAPRGEGAAAGAAQTSTTAAAAVGAAGVTSGYPGTTTGLLKGLPPAAGFVETSALFSLGSPFLSTAASATSTGGKPSAELTTGVSSGATKSGAIGSRSITKEAEMAHRQRRIAEIAPVFFAQAASAFIARSAFCLASVGKARGMHGRDAVHRAIAELTPSPAPEKLVLPQGADLELTPELVSVPGIAEMLKVEQRDVVNSVRAKFDLVMEAVL